MDDALQQLLAAWLSDDIDETELDSLLQRLRTDDSFRQAFTAEVAMLGQLRAVQSSEPRWLELEDIIASPDPSPISASDFEVNVMKHLEESDHRRTLSTAKMLTWALAAAATVMAMIGLSQLAARFGVNGQPALEVATPEPSGDPEWELAVSAPNDRPDAIDSFAVLGQAVKATWNGELKPSVGDMLGRGELKLTNGTVQIDFFTGVRLLLRAPAHIDLRGPREVLLHQGAASCYVTEMGRGFRIVTNEMEVIDVGTAFSIDVQQGKRPEVHVLDGSVEIKSPQSSRLELTEFHAIRMGEEGPEDVQFAPGRFPRPEGMRDEQRDLATQQFEEWKVYAESISSDPSILLHYTFEEADPSPIELVNRAIDPTRATNGIIVGGQWAAGRWPSKRALVYRNTGDRVLFQVPGNHETLTFVIWARIDALTQRLTSLLMTEEPFRRFKLAPARSIDFTETLARLDASPVKSVRWELSSKDLSATFSVGHGVASRMKYDFYAVGYPATHSANWGHWACLALTCDMPKRQVSHYLNGECLGVGHFDRSDPLILEFVELGNFGATSRELEDSQGLAQRRFYGAFDELIISNRVMSDAELKRIWESGKP